MDFCFPALLGEAGFRQCGPSGIVDQWIIFPNRQSAYNTSRKANQPSPSRDPLYTEIEPVLCVYELILVSDRCPLARGFWTGSATDSEIGDLPFSPLQVN